MRKRTQILVNGTALLALSFVVRGRAIGAEPIQQLSPNEWAVRSAGWIVRGTVNVQKTIPDGDRGRSAVDADRSKKRVQKRQIRNTDGKAEPHKCILTVSDVIKGPAIPGDTITFESRHPTEGAVIAVYPLSGFHPSGPLCLAETPKNLDLVTKAICQCRWNDVDGNIRNLASEREGPRYMSAWNLFRIAEPAHRELKTVYPYSVPPKERDSLLSRALEKYGRDVTKAVVSLAEADPQASKHVYIFQWYVYPKGHHSIMPPRDNYTGTWKSWYESGGRKAQMDFQNGKLHGRELHWFEDGRLSALKYFEHGYRTQAAFWFKDGNRVEIISGYHRNEAHGKRIVINKRLATFGQAWYFKGKPVTEQEFRELSK